MGMACDLMHIMSPCSDDVLSCQVCFASSHILYISIDRCARLVVHKHCLDCNMTTKLYRCVPLTFTLKGMGSAVLRQ